MLETILIIVAIVAIVLVLLASIKYQSYKVLGVIVLLVWCGLSVFSGFTLIKYNNSHSKLFGNPAIHDPYENFNYYEYDLSGISWYSTEDEPTLKFETEYKTSIKFDGNKDKYHLLVNNAPCTRTESSNGKLKGFLKKQFKNIDGEVEKIINFEITFYFYTSTIKITIETDANKEDMGYVNEYVDTNGFNLRIINAVYVEI